MNSLDIQLQAVFEKVTGILYCHIKMFKFSILGLIDKKRTLE